VEVESTPSPVAVRLALEEIRPNPTRTAPLVIYSLASWASARIELIDVAGRCELSRDLGSPGPGRHALILDPAGIRTGVYIVRLAQAAHGATSKLVLRQ
jgi:hypothetical protein